jgi:hypothetical protein
MQSRSRRGGLRGLLKHRKRALINAAIFLLVLGLFILYLIYMSSDHPDAQASCVGTENPGCLIHNKLPPSVGTKERNEDFISESNDIADPGVSLARSYRPDRGGGLGRTLHIE